MEKIEGYVFYDSFFNHSNELTLIFGKGEDSGYANIITNGFEVFPSSEAAGKAAKVYWNKKQEEYVCNPDLASFDLSIFERNERNLLKEESNLVVLHFCDLDIVNLLGPVVLGKPEYCNGVGAELMHNGITCFNDAGGKSALELATYTASEVSRQSQGKTKIGKLRLRNLEDSYELIYHGSH